MCGIVSDVPEDRKIRPHRMIVTGEVSWPVKRFTGSGPPPLVPINGMWHIAYVFQVPLEVAANRDIVVHLRPGCDQPVSWPASEPVERWHFVNAEMVHGYKCGSRLQSDRPRAVRGALVPACGPPGSLNLQQRQPGETEEDPGGNVRRNTDGSGRGPPPAISPQCGTPLSK
jgi:hypothetical protein